MHQGRLTSLALNRHVVLVAKIHQLLVVALLHLHRSAFALALQVVRYEVHRPLQRREVSRAVARHCQHPLLSVRRLRLRLERPSLLALQSVVVPKHPLVYRHVILLSIVQHIVVQVYRSHLALRYDGVEVKPVRESPYYGQLKPSLVRLVISRRRASACVPVGNHLALIAVRHLDIVSPRRIRRPLRRTSRNAHIQHIHQLPRRLVIHPDATLLAQLHLLVKHHPQLSVRIHLPAPILRKQPHLAQCHHRHQHHQHHSCHSFHHLSHTVHN